ncbi:MAG: 1-deoxy-D-xylulose-5-phosphate synthase [Clostridia bacterium]|nr:1-deoxy-D-xylulose-5-phosphate synthase [Clostridia bacterium]
MEYKILGKVNSPDDVKKLNDSELHILCDELRDCIISTVSKNGGHLASNLGAIELTVALHRAFSSPDDSIIFDVGHQCYAHKLITGRFDRFDTLRTKNGISGFMRPDESEHDPFITGHSSNSISAAYGIYKAKRISGEDGTAVAVIGDGAMTGGMAYEALNNAGSGRSNFIVVLNDNKMSISRNVGALARSLSKMRNKPRYHRFKFALSNFLLKIPFVGKYINRAVFVCKEAVKGLVYRNNVFSALGFNYLGPVDGHNISAMESLFKIAQTYNRPSLIHVITIKGKGYSFAETSPKNYHGVSPFDVYEGADSAEKVNFSKTAGDTLCRLAEKDDKICAITAAMTEGTGLSNFSQKYRSRFFDVGIAEQHAVTFAAGMAKAGLKPFFVVYSSFLQRGFDQLVHDVAIGRLPVRLLVDRAGIVGEDGETHQGLFDMSFLTAIPGICVYSPATYKELEYRIEFAADYDAPIAVRYPRGGEKETIDFDYKSEYSVIEGNGEKAVITYGRLFSEACAAKSILPDISIIKLNQVYPFSEALVNEALKYSELHFYEESVRNGGVSEHFVTLLAEKGYKGTVCTHTVENKFVSGASIAEILKDNMLDADLIVKSLS